MESAFTCGALLIMMGKFLNALLQNGVIKQQLRNFSIARSYHWGTPVLQESAQLQSACVSHPRARCKIEKRFSRLMALQSRRNLCKRRLRRAGGTRLLSDSRRGLFDQLISNNCHFIATFSVLLDVSWWVPMIQGYSN